MHCTFLHFWVHSVISVFYYKYSRLSIRCWTDLTDIQACHYPLWCRLLLMLFKSLKKIFPTLHEGKVKNKDYHAPHSLHCPPSICFSYFVPKLNLKGTCFSLVSRDFSYYSIVEHFCVVQQLIDMSWRNLNTTEFIWLELFTFPESAARNVHSLEQ